MRLGAGERVRKKSGYGEKRPAPPGGFRAAPAAVSLAGDGYSLEMALRTSIRPARHAGHSAASTPITAATTM